jgi:hypothetical protein
MDSHNPHHLHVLDSDVWGAWGASMTVDESQLVLILRAIEGMASQVTGFGLEASSDWLRHSMMSTPDLEQVGRLSPLYSHPIEIEIESIGQGQLRSHAADTIE